MNGVVARARVPGWLIPLARQGIRVRSKGRGLPLIPVLILFALITMAAFAPALAPHNPVSQTLPDRYTPPVWQDGGTWNYVLGTDRFGRDILSRLIYGARISVTVVLAVLAIGGLIGLVIGIVSGYVGGALDATLMRIVDAFIALPSLLLAILLAVTLGPSIMTTIFAISLFVWSTFARVIRGEVLSIRRRDFIKLAHVHGCSHLRVMLVYILPGVMSTWAVLATLNAGGIIITEASLSFLAAGIPPPTPSWGMMVSEGRAVMATAWWISILPGILIAVVVLSFNLFGDWLRDFLDPKLKAVR